MALLSADDVLNKKFEATKFREGYNQDEVDDFLDEVVDTLRSVYAENEELKARLEASEARVAELSSGAPADTSAADQADAEEQPATHDTAETPVVAAAPTRRSVHDTPPATPQPYAAAATAEPQAPAEQPEATDTAAPAAAAAAPATASTTPDSAAGMLAMAQRVHDEYVADGQAESARLVSEAQAESERIVSEAEAHSNRTLSQLEQERSLLERKIDELRTFERDYRTRLKSYLNQLLSTVEGGTGSRESGI
ncbi:DivIVA domain-containing protein [Georgenia sp. Z1344]|uniref:DivIVA domain-containing protein n=1 Tax=Georgenia sp. Z1344 TaxID=3416706 RepID=UPI003CEEE540